MDRRDALRVLGAALGGAALGCARDPRYASAADSAVRPPRRAQPRLGVQLYTVREAMKRSVEDTLARVARIGYREVEFAGYFDRTPARLRELLGANGLDAPSAHVPIEAVRDHLGRTLDDAATVGHRWLILPSLPEGMRRTVADLQRTAAFFNGVAEESLRHGVHFGFHNHDVDLTPVEDQLPLDVLLAETDPTLVSFELDVYWAVKAGQDPLRLLERNPGRFALLHIKDSAGPPEHRMTAVGQGTIDWPAILAARTDAGVRHLFVEHDNPEDAFAVLATSYEYLSGLGT